MPSNKAMSLLNEIFNSTLFDICITIKLVTDIFVSKLQHMSVIFSTATILNVF